MSEGKNITKVHFDRLSRFFVGTQTPGAPQEHWHEMGHFTQGVDFKLPRVFQKNGKLQHTGELLGWKVEGSYEPGQNTLDDYEFYENMMNGIRNVAFLTKDILWLFRLRPLLGGKFEDNRISLMTYPAYADTRRKGAGEFGGFLMNYEFLQVKDLLLTPQGHLTFKTVKTFMPDNNSMEKKGTINDGGK